MLGKAANCSAICSGSTGIRKPSTAMRCQWEHWRCIHRAEGNRLDPPRSREETNAEMHQYKPRDSTAVAAPLQNPRMASATSAASQRPLRPARHAVNRRLGRLQRQLATFIVLVCGICGLCASSVPEHTITATAPEFRWSYHPSFDAVQFLVLGLPPTATHWALSLSAVSSIGSGRGDGLVVRTNGSLPLPAAGVTLAVPALADGNYSIELMLTAAGGESEERRPLFTKAETFTRARRSWEVSQPGVSCAFRSETYLPI